MSEYLLENVGYDPRTLASVAANPEVAALLGLNGYFPKGRAPRTYEARLERVGYDPRTLASVAANPEVAALLGFSL